MGFGSTGQLMIIVIGVLAAVAALWGWQVLQYYDSLERGRRGRKHDHTMK
jgi:hypothetical protein